MTSNFVTKPGETGSLHDLLENAEAAKKHLPAPELLERLAMGLLKDGGEWQEVVIIPVSTLRGMILGSNLAHLWTDLALEFKRGRAQ